MRDVAHRETVERPARENSLWIAVPANSQRKMLEEAHGGCLSGHFAARSMYNILARRYWWVGT